jgi:uncharacterized membrane protein
MATPPPIPSGGNATNLGLEPKIAGLLCNIPGCCGLGIIFSVVAAIVEKQSRFVRFYAFQSLLLNGAAAVLLIGLSIAGLVLSGLIGFFVGTLTWLVQLLILLALLGVQVLLMIKANSGEELGLPVIGTLARKWA